MLSASELRFIERRRVAHLATADATGRPHVVPVCFAHLDGRFYIAIDEKPKRSLRLKRLRNIEENPQVALVFDRYDDDWSRLGWVLVQGTRGHPYRGTGARACASSVARAVRAVPVDGAGGTASDQRDGGKGFELGRSRLVRWSGSDRTFYLTMSEPAADIVALHSHASLGPEIDLLVGAVAERFLLGVAAAAEGDTNRRAGSRIRCRPCR